MEEASAAIKLMGESVKFICESPGVAALLQGHGQAAATHAERLTLAQAQDHERQMLKLKQDHERLMQFDQMNVETERRREVRRVRVAFAGALFAIACAALLLVSVRLGWIDAKTLAALGAAVGIFLAAARLNNGKSNGTPPPAQTP